MKMPLHRRPSTQAGFTLVELLVVIGIIAILAATVIGVAGPAINAAKRAKAANTANQIQTAVTAYYTEYSVYPVNGTPTGDFYLSDSDTADWKQMTEALCGNISPYNPSTTVTPTVANTRAIAFLNLKASDVDSNDCPKNPITFQGGNPYFNMVVDSDYSGLAGDSGGALSGVIPDFANSKITNGTCTIAYLTKGVANGAIVWANCNTQVAPANWNPAYIVRTY